MEEEENLVDNINLLKRINDPLINQIKQIKNSMNNLSSFIKIIINSRNFVKDSDISTPNIPNENFNFTILKSLNELNNLSRFIDRLYNFLKDKITFENNAFDEKNPNSNENQEFYNFSFKIKVSLTLKNHNNEMLCSFHSLILSLNSFFSIIFQICQVINLY